MSLLQPPPRPPGCPSPGSRDLGALLGGLGLVALAVAILVASGGLEHHVRSRIFLVASLGALLGVCWIGRALLGHGGVQDVERRPERFWWERQ